MDTDKDYLESARKVKKELDRLLQEEDLSWTDIVRIAIVGMVECLDEMKAEKTATRERTFLYGVSMLEEATQTFIQRGTKLLGASYKSIIEKVLAAEEEERQPPRMQ